MKTISKAPLVGLVCAAVVCIVLLNGCGFASLLGTPTRNERKIQAEYDLTGHVESRILVLVAQPPWLDASANMRLYLTNSLNRQLADKLEIPAENFVKYAELSEFRSRRYDFAQLSTEKIAAQFNADLVLSVTVNQFELLKMPEEGYLRGFLGLRASLYDGKSGQNLWPGSSQSKDVRVGFDIESRGQKIATERLAASAAHCTVRYLYDCPEPRFKIAEDRTDESWKAWRE